MKFTIYGRTNPPCKYCDMAKDLLTRKGFEFDFIEVTPDELRAKVPGAMSYPQIFADEIHVGGFDQLKVAFG